MRMPDWATICEAAVFLVFSAFFILYGVVPLFGGDGMGLVGADEPRYAQIAHEMLVRFDASHTLKDRLSACVTPYLYGHPWLEKPALYYWRAMFVFQEFGVHDWSARLPSASFAFIMVALIYLHMRRFRPGGHLDAALITVACAGIIGFSRGASTDMQMAAPFSIGLLGWYAWYETDSKFWLFDIYFFTGVATLAKGPVAPLLAIVIVAAFAFLRKEWSIVQKSVWWPGIALYFAITLPWFIAVQHQNPTFFREFFLEHNLERFATNRYQHSQPFWYYVVVVLLAVMPWTVIAVRALVDGIQTSVAEWRLRRSESEAARAEPAGGRVSGVSGALGDHSCHFLLVFALKTAGIHSAFDSADHDSYGGLSVPAARAGVESLGTDGPCRGLRADDDVCLAAAMVCEPWTRNAADAGTCRCVAGFGRGSAADRGGGEGLRRGAATSGHQRGAGGAGVFPVWGGTVFRGSGNCRDKAGDSPARQVLLGAAAGRSAGAAGAAG